MQDISDDLRFLLDTEGSASFSPGTDTSTLVSVAVSLILSLHRLRLARELVFVYVELEEPLTGDCEAELAFDIIRDPPLTFDVLELGVVVVFAGTGTLVCNSFIDSTPVDCFESGKILPKMELCLDNT